MERTQRTMPVFFSSQLFDYLKIDLYKRATAQSKIEYLRLQKEDVEALTKAKITQEGFFWDVLHYVQFELKFGSLLCVFGHNGECCRAYFFSNIEAN